MGEAARRINLMTLTFTAGECAVFRKRSEEPVSLWCERAIRVMDGPYAGGGWKNSVTPYLAGIMDAWADWSVIEIRVCGAPQTGKTRALYNCLSYSIDRRPGPKMLAMPDDDALKKVSQHKLLPGLKASPVTRRRLVKSSLSVFEFSDGSPLYMASAQSASDRASVSVRDMFMDEEDLYQKFATQGDPVTEFLERLISYRFKSKAFRVSKPIGGEESSIWQGLCECDEVRAYAAKCPACGEYQIMRLSQIKFNGCRDPLEMRRKGLARYECERCQYKWSDHARDVAVRRGEWVPAKYLEGKWVRVTASSEPRVVGFHLPALISPFVSLSEIAADFLEATQNPAKWKGFFNGRLAEPYRPKKIKTSVERVLDLRDVHLPPRVVPAAAVALTAGIDTQKRGFWFAVRAWTAGLSSWLVDYGFLLTFEDVYKQIFEVRYPQEETGMEYGIWRAGIDSGGGDTESDVWTRTEEVYQFVRNMGAAKLFATKGASHAQIAPIRISQIDKMPKSGIKIPGGLNLYILDTDWFKRLIHARMGEEHSQPMRLNAEVREDYAKQITAEELVEVKGKHVWQSKGDNHLLDCEVGAAACAAAEWMPSLQMMAAAEAARAVAAAAPAGASGGDRRKQQAGRW